MYIMLVQLGVWGHSLSPRQIEICILSKFDEKCLEMGNILAKYLFVKDSMTSKLPLKT